MLLCTSWPCCHALICGVLSLVCGSWRSALLPQGPVMALRKKLSISHTCLVFVSPGELLFVDPACHACLSTYHFPPHYFQAPLLRGTNRSLRPPMAVRSEILIPELSVGSDLEGYDATILHCFDVQTMQWKAPAPSYGRDTLLTKALGYATAAIDECAYLAGGLSVSTQGILEMKFIKRAEKYDIRTRTWEAMPDTQQGRMFAHAVVLQGRFCIVGGRMETGFAYSGEIWDPSSRKWTWSQELWPASVFGKHMLTSCIASVKGMLYALKWEENEDVQELMYYEEVVKLWISMDKFCFPRLVEREHGACSLCKDVNSFYQMLGVGEELLVICRAEPPTGRKLSKEFTFSAILSTKPTPSQPITWKIWPLKYPVAVFAEPLVLHV